MSLQEADFDHRQFTTPDAGDDKLYVRFLHDVVPDPEKTKAEGRPIFKEVPFIFIQVPGNLLNNVRRPVREGDKQRFPRQWAAFEAGADQNIGSGMPLEKWAGVTRAQAEELKFFKIFKIFTVEQLANVADNLVQKYMGIQALKTAAKDYLASATDGRAVVQLRERASDDHCEKVSCHVFGAGDATRSLHRAAGVHSAFAECALDRLRRAR